MQEYEFKGKYAEKIRCARVRIMADFEKKLHVPFSTGAIFALKSLGWNDRTEPKQVDVAANSKVILEIIQTSPPIGRI